MAFTTIDVPHIYFNTLVWTGNNASSRAFTGLGFQANMMWSKNRTSGHQHNLVDTVRGVDQRLITPSGNNVEDTTCTHGHFESLDNDGFTITSAGGSYNVNRNDNKFVGWFWKAGTSFSNDASSTGIGSIDSTGSVNTTSGFSIVSWTGTGSAGTIKHGLSSAPSWMIVKNRDSAEAWGVYNVGNTSAPATEQIYLNLTNATADGASHWNDTAPTSSVFTVGTSTETNKSSSPMIAYCWSEIKGYSKFGGYVGNGTANGPFVYTGFKPAFLMLKRTDSADSWLMSDNKRTGVGNGQNYNVLADAVDNEDGGVGDRHDFLSNGFALKNAWSRINADGGTYIYMAFAEEPFVSSTGIPGTAR